MGKQRVVGRPFQHVYVDFLGPYPRTESESLLSDNGSKFISKEFKEFISNLGTKHVRTGSYAPQSNASERVNRTILASIRAYIESQHDIWDLHLHEIDGLPQKHPFSH